MPHNRPGILSQTRASEDTHTPPQENISVEEWRSDNLTKRAGFLNRAFLSFLFFFFFDYAGLYSGEVSNERRSVV